MKSSTKTKPRVTNLTLLKSIDRRLELISKHVEPIIVSVDAPTELARDNKARFIKLDEHGKPLLASAKTWSAVRDLKQGLDWSAEDVGAAMPWADAKDACAKLALCGAKDWRLPTVEELFLLADRSRREPAIDVAFFPSCKSSYYWTSSPCAGHSDYAWIVDFDGGYSGWSVHGNRYLVRAVRPSQF